jgi:hypothetical protein
MPKTGSSAIQALLALNPEYLLIKGYTFPAHQGFKQAFQTSAGNVPQMRHWIENENNQGFALFLQQSLTKKVILSSEILFTTLKNHPQKFAQLIKPYDYKIICYVRRMDELVESCINQQVKNHNLVDYSQANKIAETFNFYSCLSGAVKYIDQERIIIKNYDRDFFRNGNILLDFLSIFKLKNSKLLIYPEKQVNPSLNFSALELRRLLNRIQIDKTDLKLKYKINALLAKYSVEKIEPKTRVLSSNQKNELIKHFQSQSRQFANQFEIEFDYNNTDYTVKTKANKPPNIKEVLEFIKLNDNNLYQQIIDYIKSSKYCSEEIRSQLL